jgi:uncharacterized protein
MEQQAEYIHPVHSVYDGCISSFTKKKIDLINPTEDMICLEDIANALSKICRFGGHISELYTVAQHSLFVAALAPPSLKKAALLHDAAEAYLGDVTKPLKIIIGKEYAKLEARFEQVIFSKYGVDITDLERIKPYDMLALEIEHAYFFKNDPAEFIKIRQRFFSQTYNIWSPNFSKTKLKISLNENFEKEVANGN